jgi:hypothetical protein
MGSRGVFLHLKPTTVSFPRMRESGFPGTVAEARNWIPACAGMTPGMRQTSRSQKATIVAAAATLPPRA